MTFCAALITACGGGGGVTVEQDLGGAGWVTISGPDTTSGLTASVSGKAFISPTMQRCCSGDASDTGVTVSWSNETTGASGPAVQTPKYGYFFFTPFLSGHRWSASVPLALGSNVITVTASDSSGNFGHASLTVSRTPDTAPPAISLTSPLNQATGLPVDANLSVLFSEPMDPTTVNETSFLLFDSSNNIVPGTVTYTERTARAIFDPINLLVGGSTYTAKITTLARDLAGNNPLASDFAWSFSTGSNAWLPVSMNSVTGFAGPHGAVWSGTRMIVWGNSRGIADGASYDPASDSWQPISLVGGPLNRDLHSAVWSGSEMIVWGGTDGTTGPFNTGAIYNPGSDAWRAMTTIGAPSARVNHTAVWTGTEMIVWGGIEAAGDFANTGAIYNPVADTWRPMTTNGAPSGRTSHTAVWTGTEMIVWGGNANNAVITNTGGRYNPVSDSWQATTISNAPSGRRAHSAVWTGTEMVVWGGWRNSSSTFVVLNTGGRYDPATDAWTPTATVGAPSGRQSHLALWTGSEMFLWGGMEQSNTLAASGGRYDPATDKWSQMATSGAPSVNSGHKAVWTGTAMVVWGCESFTCTGGRFIP